MKKLLSSFMVLAAAVLAMFTSCKKDNPDDPFVVVGTVSQSELLAVIATVSAQMDKDFTIPDIVKAGGIELSTSQFQYAEAKLLVDLINGATDPIKIIKIKDASSPTKDNYDKKEMAVTGGEKDAAGNTEDLKSIAERFLKEIDEKGQVPNQIGFSRGTNDARAFSTNRFTIVAARTLAVYSAKKEMPKIVTTNYKPAGEPETIGTFAKYYVTMIDRWEENTGNFQYDKPGPDPSYTDVIDGHYIPMNATITVGSRVLNTADMFEAAARSYLLLRGWDGNDLDAGNGTFPVLDQAATFDNPLPETHNYVWGVWPFNEAGSTTFGGKVEANGGHLMMGDPYKADGVPCQVKLDILDNVSQRFINYSLSHDLLISNMCGYHAAQLEGYYGCFCSQRYLVTMAFFFKYMLDNNLTTATEIDEDVIFRSELFGNEEAVEKPAIQLLKEELVFAADGESQTIEFTATKDWTATSNSTWTTIDPASGDATISSATVTVEANNEDADREAEITFAAGDITVVLKVTQKAPVKATIGDFATEYVKVIDLWEKTTGDINWANGVIPEGNPEGLQVDAAGAHYIPEDTKLTICGKDYTLGDAFEIALRSWISLRGRDGNSETGGWPAGGESSFPLLDKAATMDSPLPTPLHNYWFQPAAYSESAGNNGPLIRIDAEGNEHHCQVTTDILDNAAQRFINWGITRGGEIANLCGYPRTGNITNYKGAFTARRALVTWAFVFKYMLDNNINTGFEIGDDVIIRSENLGLESAE